MLKKKHIKTRENFKNVLVEVRNSVAAFAVKE